MGKIKHKGALLLVFILISGLGFINIGMDYDPMPLSRPGYSAQYPSLTIDNKGNLVVSWTEKDNEEIISFHYVVSTDQGLSFPLKYTAPLPKNIKVHGESMPKIAFKKDGTIFVIFQTSEPGGRFSSNVRYIHSSNNGKSWSASKSISSDTLTGKSRSFFDIATLADGEIGIIWLDHKIKEEAQGRPVHFAKTNGKNFLPAKVIDEQACECCRTKIFIDGSGKIHFAYRDLLSDGSRDMAYVSSKDNGNSFSKPVTISADQWKINACPHSGPSLASDSKGVHCVWYTGKEGNNGVFYTSLSNISNEFSPKKLVTQERTSAHPQLTNAGKESMAIAWDEPFETENQLYRVIKLKTVGKNDIDPFSVSADTVTASYPVLCKTSENDVLVAWQQQVSDKTEIYVRRVKLRK